MYDRSSPEPVSVRLLAIASWMSSNTLGIAQVGRLATASASCHSRRLFGEICDSPEVEYFK